MQQEFCHLQKLSTHKNNNNYHCVQSNKKGGRYTKPVCRPPALLFGEMNSSSEELFCVTELLYQLPSLLFLFIRFEMQ